MNRITLVGILMALSVCAFAQSGRLTARDLSPAFNRQCQNPCASAYACRETFPREQYWRLSVMPYIWAAGLKGTVTAKGIPAQVDASFGDILDVLDYAAFGQIELARGRCFIMTDSLLLKASIEASAEKRFLGPLKLGEFKGEAAVNLETFFWFQDLVGGYRVYEKDLGDCGVGSRRFSFDLLAGFRYYLIDLNLNASAKVTAVGPGGGTVTRKRSASISHEEDWWDPIVGARMQYDVTHRLALELKGDVGGFGVGSDSAWSAQGIARYRLGNHWSLVGGYKVLDVDYTNSKGSALDARVSGPIAGIEYVIRF